MQAATRVNVEQASKQPMWEPTFFRQLVFGFCSELGSTIHWNADACDPTGAVRYEKRDHIRHIGGLGKTNAVGYDKLRRDSGGRIVDD